MNNEQITQIRSLLMTRRSELVDVLDDTEDVLRDQLAPMRDGYDVSYQDPSEMLMEAGDPDYEKELQLAKHQREELGLVDEALWRLDNGSYGLCESCGDDIPFSRLLAIPYARDCIRCRAHKERARRGHGDALAP